MDLKQYLFPQVVKKYESNLNKDIELVNFSGQLRLDMGGLTQSGKIIESIWNTGFRKLLTKGFIPQKVLILGFGAGSAAKLIRRKWPKSQITGIEIDAAVIQIGKDHFQVEKISDLTILNADAYKYVMDSNEEFDLTIIDCYLGDQIPKSLESLKFLKKLKSISTHVLINRLFWSQHKKITLEFLDKLDQNFVTKNTRTPSNFLISIS